MTTAYTTDPKLWIKEFRKDALQRIQAEATFCEDNKQNEELLENRLVALNLCWSIGEHLLDTIVFNKSSGPIKAKDDKFIKKFFEQAKKYGVESTREQVERLISDYKLTNKISTIKEKFWRYAYNLNLVKAIKYHSKLHEMEFEVMEKMREDINDDTKVVLIVDESINEKEDEVSKGETAYLNYCKTIKENYENRKNILKSITEVLKAT